MNKLNKIIPCGAIALLLAFVLPAVGQELRAQRTGGIYSPDSDHLWNRLYSDLFVRTVGSHVFDDLLDPLFYRKDNHFLAGESNTRALALLGEFVGDRNVLAQMTPLQRAVMQRDLLAMFHWVHSAQRSQEREKLKTALARAIQHVALTAEEIRKLPDNYAIAVSLPGAHTSFDVSNPKRAFLPKSLLVEDGPWLALEPRFDRPLAAPVHFAFVSERSAFDLYFYHPEGRKAGAGYLDSLATMRDPLLSDRPAMPVPGINLGTGRWLNPDTPQFPPGSMWALVRRPLLVDVTGKAVVSSLVESIEVRVYRALADIASQPEAQTFFGWELRRRLLLGKGGFHLTDGREFSLSPFLPHSDKLEKFVKLPVNHPLTCFGCHSAPGIHSVNSRTLQFFTGAYEFEARTEPTRLSEFRPTTQARLAAAAEKVAARQEGWRDLSRLWGER